MINSQDNGRQSEVDVILDAWIRFLISLKDKADHQIREIIGEPDIYFGIGTVGYQGTIRNPKTNESNGTFSMIWENGIPKHINLTTPTLSMFPWSQN